MLATRGGDGALLTDGYGQWRIQAPRVTVTSPIGAGDSCLGSVAFSLARGRSLLDAARLGLAAAAALLTPATELARRRDILRLEKATRVWRIRSKARI